MEREQGGADQRLRLEDVTRIGFSPGAGGLSEKEIGSLERPWDPQSVGLDRERGARVMACERGIMPADGRR